MQRHVAVFGHCVGVGAVAQQQLGALWLAVFTGLVEGGDASWGQLHVGPSLQQEPQAFGEASAGRDVQRRRQLLLITQRPQPWQQKKHRL